MIDRTESDAAQNELMTLSEAANSLAGRPHKLTLWRWTKKGVKGVKLRTTRVGSRVYVSREQLEDFQAAVAAAYNGESPPKSATRTIKQRQRDIAKAEKTLRDAGI